MISMLLLLDKVFMQPIRKENRTIYSAKYDKNYFSNFNLSNSHYSGGLL